ncbi:LOW QUALITY PROTEIN: heat shock-related 70 kDa protein 2-like [Trichechus inunguis]
MVTLAVPLTGTGLEAVGGPFDVSILNIQDDIFEVKFTAGDTHVGGEDLDNRMICHLMEELNCRHRKYVAFKKQAACYHQTACEKAKCILSFSANASIEVDSLYVGVDFYTSISETRSEELTAAFLHSALKLVEKALNYAKLDKGWINVIVLGGGSIHLPVQKLLRYFFNEKELNKTITLDEVVAYSAAVQVAILIDDKSENVQDLLLDVSFLSLGIEMTGGIMTPMIKKNTNIPMKQIQMFTTDIYYQITVSVKVHEGERAFAKSNKLVGKFKLSEIPLVYCGIPKIQLVFNIDTYGILSVTAADKSTSRKNKFTITNSKGRLNKDDLDHMMEDAGKYRIDDQVTGDRVAARNTMESYIFDVKLTVENNL